MPEASADPKLVESFSTADKNGDGYLDNSEFDYRTDAALREGLAKELPETTKIIVAQRISTVRRADRIIVLDRGEAVGTGTHDELMKTCPVYREIAESQLSASELR